MTAKEAFDHIVGYIKKQGGQAKDWYAGIAADPEKRLFTDHNVSKDNGWWAYAPCGNDETARAAESLLLDHGCDGGPSGGDEDTTWVYAYLKTPETVE
jgi:hypothetical protein